MHKVSNLFGLWAKNGKTCVEKSSSVLSQLKFALAEESFEVRIFLSICFIFCSHLEYERFFCISAVNCVKTATYMYRWKDLRTVNFENLFLFNQFCTLSKKSWTISETFRHGFSKLSNLSPTCPVEHFWGLLKDARIYGWAFLVYEQKNGFLAWSFCQGCEKPVSTVRINTLKKCRKTEFYFLWLFRYFVWAFFDLDKENFKVVETLI